MSKKHHHHDTDQWNKSSKHSLDSIHSKTCVYRQVYNVNPMMGGFTYFGNTYEESAFNSYSFTGNYKLLAEGDYVKVITTESCSNMSVSFYKALVVFQPIVKPDTRYSECSQDVQFIENEYKVEISPFEIYSMTVGTIVEAVNGSLHFTTWKLPSKTNQDKISEALYDRIQVNKQQLVIIDDNDNIVPQSSLKAQVDVNLNPPRTAYGITATTPKGVSPNIYQYLQLFTSFSSPSWKFVRWYVVEVNNGKLTNIKETTDPDGTKGYKVFEGKKYRVGYVITSIASGGVLSLTYAVYDIYTPILTFGSQFVTTANKINN